MKSYETQGDLHQADCVVGFSFGTSINPGSVNAQLGSMMLGFANELPLIMDRTLADAIPNDSTQKPHIIEGEPTHGLNQGLTTQKIWREAQKYMNNNHLERPLIIAQAYHVSRVIEQGAKLGIQSIVPPDLPTDFDGKSKQFWTRSAHLWLPINAMSRLFLKAHNQI